MKKKNHVSESKLMNEVVIWCVRACVCVSCEKLIEKNQLGHSMFIENEKHVQLRLTHNCLRFAFRKTILRKHTRTEGTITIAIVQKPLQITTQLNWKNVMISMQSATKLLCTSETFARISFMIAFLAQNW